MQYNVATIRAAGLEAKWSKTRKGAPIIVAKSDKTARFYYVDKHMWERAKEVGIKEAFEEHTLLGDIFYVAV